MRLWSDTEVQTIIDELSEAAHEAIEQAAAEAARSAALASLEREAEALKEAENWRNQVQVLQRGKIKNGFIIGAICFLGGLVTGFLIQK